MKRALRVGAYGLPAALFPLPLAAHSFGQVYNLPVPVWLYLYGAAAALLASFVVVAYFAGAQSAGPSRSLLLLRTPGAPRLVAALRAVGVLLLALCVLTGLFGTRNAYGNFNMTCFWIVFLLGYAYLVALTGDSFAALSPWRSLADGIARCWPGYARGRLPYPLRLGYVPALLLYMGLIWLELFGNSRPWSLSWWLLGYSALNLIGVGLVGLQAWFRYCEFFSVLLRLLALCAPLQYRRGEGLYLRWPFAGLLEQRAEHLSLLLFVLFMLSSTAFDGLHETTVWTGWFWLDAYEWLKPWVGANPFQAYPRLRPLYLAWQTAALLLSPLLYLGVYLLFVWLMKHAARSALPLRSLALHFTHSLIPIALVYHLTHYYTLLLVQGPKIVSLASDPFGRGWNLFGTAGWLRSPYIPDMGTVWHVQVGLIVCGHIVSVWLAHVEALRLFPDRRRAALSQLPMLLLMVLFTTAGLWILAQPIKPGA